MTRPEVSVQLTAIADLRWRMFLNGLRSKRGKTELASRVLITLAFTLGGSAISGVVAPIAATWLMINSLLGHKPAMSQELWTW